jgi:Rad3-related DNA helicase
VARLCLDPSKELGPRIAGLGGFVAASATLTPASFYRDLFGLEPGRYRTVVSHGAFPPENRKVVVVPRVSTAWRDRAREAEPTAALIERCIRVVPGNAAVYFPSFAMLRDLAARWALPVHEVLIQEPGMSEPERQALLARLSAGRPMVLAAVLGGVFAEGIDLPPGALDAVMVVGPALPPVGLERDLLRAFFEDRYGEGFRYASLIPGMTRVVQAAGRLLRRPEDRGAIVLFDRRFRWRDYRELLPEDWDLDVPDDPAAAIEAFFTYAASGGGP